MVRGKNLKDLARYEKMCNPLQMWEVIMLMTSWISSLLIRGVSDHEPETVVILGNCGIEPELS